MPDRHHHHHHHHYRDHDRDRSGYAYRAGEPGPGPNFHRLRRDMRNKKIAGVCAGIANYFDWDPLLVRLLWVLSFFIMGPFTILTYALCAFLIAPAHGPAAIHTPEEERFWRTFSVKPKATFSELKHRFRALDMRVSDMERAVTSNEYGLKKAFQDLERGA